MPQVRKKTIMIHAHWADGGYSSSKPLAANTCAMKRARAQSPRQSSKEEINASPSVIHATGQSGRAQMNAPATAAGIGAQPPIRGVARACSDRRLGRSTAIRCAYPARSESQIINAVTTAAQAARLKR